LRRPRADKHEADGGGRSGGCEGIPTGKFRNRLVQMAHNAGLPVIAVDPAYTSRWGPDLSNGLAGCIRCDWPSPTRTQEGCSLSAAPLLSW
jgi:hypothetical protein